MPVGAHPFRLVEPCQDIVRVFWFTSGHNIGRRKFTLWALWAAPELGPMLQPI